jgi:hypothetical protein
MKALQEIRIFAIRYMMIFGNWSQGSFESSGSMGEVEAPSSVRMDFEKPSKNAPKAYK